MDEIKSSFHCGRVLLWRELGNPKLWLVIVILVVFSYYNYSPLCEISRFYQVPVTPWTFPFFLSFPTMLLVNSGLYLLLFSDVGEVDGYASLMINRCGRRAYILGQIWCVFSLSFLYAALLWLLSIVFTLPAIDWDGDWGVLLHTLAESSAQVQDQTGVSLSILVAPEILAVFSPVEAALMSFGCIWLSAVFTGILICFFRVYISQMAGIFAAGIFVCMTLLTTSLGMVTFGRWLSFISPLTWAGFHTLDWYYSGISPSPSYAFSVWIIGIAGMGAAVVWRFCRRDLE